LDRSSEYVSKNVTTNGIKSRRWDILKDFAMKERKNKSHEAMKISSNKVT